MSKYVKFESFAHGIVDEETDIKEVHVDGLLTGSHDMDILAYCYMQAKSAREIAVHIDVTPSTFFRNSIISC